MTAAPVDPAMAQKEGELLLAFAAQIVCCRLACPDEIAQRRLEGLIELHREIQAEINRGAVGRVEEVMVEKEGRRGGLQGRTDGNKVVTFEGPVSLIGEFARVRLDATTGATFMGSMVEGGATQRVA